MQNYQRTVDDFIGEQKLLIERVYNRIVQKKMLVARLERSKKNFKFNSTTNKDITYLKQSANYYKVRFLRYLKKKEKKRKIH